MAKTRNTKPKVSILCPTYNHANFIEQALEGFLMQKADFAFEVLVNDDASDDGTVEILEKYQKKYPKIIKLNLQKKNLFSQGIRNVLMRYLLPKAEGEYIALCEGDDYWTDSNKLQKQVDFLQKNPEYSLCFHPVWVRFENGEKEPYIFPHKGTNISLESLLKDNFIQTNSVMYRRLNYSALAVNVIPGDWYLHLFHAKSGKIGFLDEPMGVYRRHSAGVWWDTSENRVEMWKKNGINHLLMFEELFLLFNNKKHEEIIKSNQLKIYHEIAKTDLLKNTKITENLVSKHKKIASSILREQHKKIEYLRSTLDANEDIAKRVLNELRQNKELNKQLRGSLDNLKQKQELIEASRVWRARNKIVRFIRRGN